MPFTATGTAVITGVTHLLGGLTQVDFSTSGTGTATGMYTGTISRPNSNQEETPLRENPAVPP